MDFILETLGKVGFDLRMGLFNLVNFFIVLFIIKKLFFKPIQKTVRERQEKAKESVFNFQKAKTELQMAEKKAQEILDEAKGEANTIIEKAHDTAAEQGEKMKEKAKAEIELLIAQAKKNIALEKADMKEELRSETVALVLQVTEKLLGEKMDDKKQQDYIQNMLSSLKK